MQKSVLKEKSNLETFASVSKSLAPNVELISKYICCYVSSTNYVLNVIIILSTVQPGQVYAQLTSRMAKIWPTILESILKVGHMQLLRRHLAAQLRAACHFDAKELATALKAMNL